MFIYVKSPERHNSAWVFSQNCGFQNNLDLTTVTVCNMLHTCVSSCMDASSVWHRDTSRPVVLSLYKLKLYNSINMIAGCKWNESYVRNCSSVIIRQVISASSCCLKKKRDRRDTISLVPSADLHRYHKKSKIHTVHMKSFSLWEQQGLPTSEWNVTFGYKKKIFLVFVFLSYCQKYQKSKPSCFFAFFG